MPLTSVLFFSLCFPLFCCYFLLFHVFCCCHLTASAEPPDTPLDVRDSQADLQPVKYDSEQGSEKVSQPPLGQDSGTPNASHSTATPSLFLSRGVKLIQGPTVTNLPK